MSVTVPKSYLYQILFALCVSIPYLNNYELTFSLWSLTALFTLQRKYSAEILKLLSCYLGILSIALIVLFFKEHLIYYIIRDITYMLKPIFGVLIGYQLCKNNYKKGIQTIVFTGLLLAIFHLTILASAVLVHGASTVNDLRLYGGYFSDFEIYALIIILFNKKFELGFSKKRTLYFTIIVGFSAFMYLSRINFIQFIILFLAMKGYFKINITSIKVITSVLVFLILGYSTILYINPKRNGHGIEAMLYKIKIAPVEPFKTKINKDDWKDFNDNYRSYENINTIKQMIYHDTPTILFGKGIGSKVDLKQEVMLGDMKLRYISFLHNSFMTVFLKSGVLGIFIYFIPFYLLIKNRKSNITIVQSVNLLLVGTGIFLIFSNWVFMGVYNLLDSKSILFGFFICYREISLKSQIPYLK